MTSKRSARTPIAPRVIAAVLMLGFFAWILLQMAPHGPRDGALLVRLGLGIAAVLVAIGLVLLMGRLARHRARGADHRAPEQAR